MLDRLAGEPQGEREGSGVEWEGAGGRVRQVARRGADGVADEVGVPRHRDHAVQGGRSSTGSRSGPFRTTAMFAMMPGPQDFSGEGSGVDPVQLSLADEVREQVRRRRIDPRAEADAVRQVALDVVADHERRSLTGAVRSLDEPERVVGSIVADVAGFGPLQPYLDDPTVEEVWVNEPSLVR